MKKAVNFASKMDKVITDPRKWATVIRSQLGRECLPFLTYNQIKKERQLALWNGLAARVTAIEAVLDELIRQEMADGVGSREEAVAYLSSNVSMGRVLVADIEKVHALYTRDLGVDVDRAFVHLPKIAAARDVAERLAAEEVEAAIEAYQVCVQKLEQICSLERAAGVIGTDVEILTGLHG